MPPSFSDRLRRASDRLRARARAFSTWMPPRFGGVGLPPPGYPTTNRATESRVSGRDALEGRIAVGAGPILDRYSTYAATQLDPVKIESILKQADLGVVIRYADLCKQVLERD